VENPPVSAPLTARDVLAVRDVRALLIANLFFSSGITLQATALALQVFDITGRELDIGLLGLAEFLPALLLVLVTGSVADRYDRRRVGALALSGEVACSLVLVAYTTTSPSAVWPIFLVAIAFGAFRAFVAPATRSLPPMVAPPGGLSRVIALYSATWTAALIMGPAASGFLYAASPSAPYVVSAVLVGVGAVLIATLRIAVVAPAVVAPVVVAPVVVAPVVVAPDPAMLEPALADAANDPTVDDDAVTLRHALEGLRFIRRTPVLFAAIALDLFAVLFGGAVALLPVIATERLGVGPVGYGWLRAAPGIGAAVMAVVLAAHPLSRHIGRRLLAAVAVFGVCTVVLGLTTSYVVAFVALVVLAGADMISVFIRATLVPLITPDDKRGRVLAVENVFIGGSNELGAFESGVAAQLVGTQAAVIGGGVATLGIVAVWWRRFAVLRDIDRFDDVIVPTG
jgi:MFS family permease